MEFDPNQELILQLILEDVADFENKQKGKQAAGKHTDLELALVYMEEEALATQAFIQDRIMALSTSTAIATDQNLLASIKFDERIAEQDHQYVLSLDNEEPIPQNSSYDIAINKATSPDENEDAVSVVIGDLMGRMTLNDETDNGEGSSRYNPSLQAANSGDECVSCLEKCDTTMFVGSCGHGFCHDCTRQMFLGATKDEELYPPRCCGNIVPPRLAMRVLNYEELRDFSEGHLNGPPKIDYTVLSQHVPNSFLRLPFRTNMALVQNATN